MKNVFYLVVCFLITLGCKDKASYENEIAEAPSVEATANAEVVKLAKMDIPEKPVESKIIRTSNLRFETSNLNEAYSNIKKAVDKHKGSIQNDVSGKDYGSSYRKITIRIPNTSFIVFLDDISKGVSYFDKREISSQDVTEEYIDVEARMNAKKNLEKRYLQLLTKAVKVSEIIEIEKQLAAIREEIESKEGQLRYMKNQISMSTVNLEMYTNDASESGDTASFGGKIWNAIKSGFNDLSSFFVGLISLWPLVIILVLIFIFIKKRYKKKSI